MPKFGKRSMANLSTCHPDLQRLFTRVVERYDCSVIEGHRSNERQDELYHAGKSKVKAGGSKHNSKPSKGVDVVPYPIDWNNRDRFHYFAGYVQGVANELGIKIRWGGDWDSDMEINSADKKGAGFSSFDDLPHFEIA